MELWFREAHTPNVKLSIRVDTQIHIHKDEGYMNARKWTPNLHAHVVFDWTQPNGKAV